jgi:hypothetical protein
MLTFDPLRGREVLCGIRLADYPELFTLSQPAYAAWRACLQIGGLRDSNLSLGPLVPCHRRRWQLCVSPPLDRGALIA